VEHNGTIENLLADISLVRTILAPGNDVSNKTPKYRLLCCNIGKLGLILGIRR
jgi:hypothetical protein